MRVLTASPFSCCYTKNKNNKKTKHVKKKWSFQRPNFVQLHFKNPLRVETPLSKLPIPKWPQHYYPELSGVDLLMADVNALVTYATYFYYLSKLWTKPLPEDGYDPEAVAYYFSLRPHLVALRLLEVFSSVAVAAIRVRMLGVGNVPRSAIGENIDGDVMQYGVGMIVKETMLNLGPTFIKVGQSLSTRPDIIGSEISMVILSLWDPFSTPSCELIFLVALSELHDQIPPFPRAMAMKIIEEELGCPVEKNFSQISEEAVAAASFGQVYHGQTVDGLNVAVKVQRPYLRDVVVRDIYILRIVLGLVRKIAKRKSDIRVYADELGKGLVGELDYTLEAANASQFKEAHAPFPFIRVPKVYKHLSGKRVLTMEWIAGESSSDLVNLSTQGSTSNGSSYLTQQQTDAKRRLLDLANHGVEATLVQLLDTGLLHADPHPGNLRYTSSGEIGFLDFGLLCRMQKKHQFAMLSSIVHIVNGDWASLVNDLTDMDVARPGTNLRRVATDLEDALGEIEFKDGIPDVKFSRVLGQIWSVAIKYHLRMPPYYTLVLRSLASLEGLAMASDPNFKTFEAAFPYVVQKLLTDNSAASKKILYSVVLNKRKEFQWQKLALFLRVGTSRKGLLRLVASNDGTSSLEQSKNGMFDLTEWVLRFLCSKDGVVMRKLLMTANGASLIRSVVTKEAKFVRRSMCMLIAEVIYQWMFNLAFGLGIILIGYPTERGLPLVGSRIKKDTRSTSSRCIIDDYRKLLSDRRLKVICLKVLNSAKRDDPILVLRFCWTSALMLITASALAFHRMLIALSETYLGPTSGVSFATKREYESYCDSIGRQGSLGYDFASSYTF